MKNGLYTGLRAEVMSLASKPTGVSTGEVPGFSVRQAHRAVQGLMDQGVLHRGRASGHVVRFFVDREDAEAFEDAAILARHAVQSEPPAAIAPWPADAPTHYPTNVHGVPMWKLTLCPGGEAPSNSPARAGERSGLGSDDY